MWHWQKGLLVAVLVSGGWSSPGTGEALGQTEGAVPDAARKAVASRQETMAAVRERLMRGDRMLADGDAAGAFAEYRAAFQGAPGFAVGQSLQSEAFGKYQLAARRYGDQLAQGGRLGEARKVIEDVYKDARDAGVNPRAVDEETKRMMADLQNPDVYNPAVTAAHVDRVRVVEKALQTAEGAFRIGDFDEASRQYALVLNVDPTNSAARRGLERVDDHLNSQYGAAAFDHTRAKMLNEVAKAWENPVPRFRIEHGLPGEELQGRPAEAGSVEEKLRSLVVPEVEFAETPLRDALGFLSNRSRLLDPAGQGVNIVLRAQDQSAGDRPVTMSMRNAPLGTVIEYVGRMVGMKYRVDGFAVSVVPIADLSSSDLVLKSYRVPPGFLSEGTMVGESDPFGGAAADPFAAPAGQAATPALQPKLGAKEFLEKNGVSFPPGGAAQFNAQTSTLIVRNTQDQLDLVETLVENSFGNVSKLVRIEVKAIEIAQNHLEEAGFDWLLGSFGVGDRIQMGGGTYGNVTNGGAGDFPTVDGAGNPVPNMPVTGGLRSGEHALSMNSIDAVLQSNQRAGQTPSRATGIFSATGLLTNPQFQTVLRAVSQHKGTDSLLSSNVVVRSGETATVKNVREFIYPTEYDPPELPQAQNVVIIGSGGSSTQPIPAIVSPAHPTAFSTREVGAQMQVEGIIAPDGHTVQLTLAPEIVELDGFVDYGTPMRGAGLTSTLPNNILMPVFSVERATVTVDVYSGSTQVIAGLLQERVQQVQDKVPGLGDVPFVGTFFRQKTESREKRALLFFVTPLIIDPAGTPVGQVAEKSGSGMAPQGNP